MSESAPLKPQSNFAMALWQDMQRLISDLVGLRSEVDEGKKDIERAIATAEETAKIPQSASKRSEDASARLEALEQKLATLEQEVRGLKISRGKARAKRDQVLSDLTAMKAKEKKARASLRSKRMH